MAARAMWKGVVTFGAVAVPVKLYAAIKSDRGVHFRLLDDRRHEPIKQQMVDPSTGDVVPYADIKRAAETQEGSLVILDEDELADIVPAPSREIDVQHFIAPERIAPQWYDRPYYLGPDGDEKAYFALVEALKKEEKEGLARWVMRNKEYVGALRVEGDYLMLITLRHAGEVVSAKSLEPPAGRDLEKREVEMAKQLVAAMAGDLDMDAYKDEYKERVLDLVKAKAAGKVVKLPRLRTKKTEKSLEEMLEKSLAATKERASA